MEKKTVTFRVDVLLCREKFIITHRWFGKSQMISRILVSFQSPGSISLKLQLEEEVSSSKFVSCYSLGDSGHYNSLLTLTVRLIYLPQFGLLFLVCYVWRMTLNFVLPPPEPTCQGLQLKAVTAMRSCEILGMHPSW